MIENGIINQLNIVWIIIMSCYISTYHVKSLLICCWNVVKQELVLRPTLWSFFLVETESVTLPSVFLVETESVVSSEAEWRELFEHIGNFFIIFFMKFLVVLFVCFSSISLVSHLSSQLSCLGWFWRIENQTSIG